MKSHLTYVKVRYAETDQMGVVYHGNYAQYLEIARIDWLSSFGVSYRKLEESGLMLPVYELKMTYKGSAKFDDTLRIETRLLERPGVKIRFSYEIFNEADELLTTANTTLVFMDSVKKKPIKCPDELLRKFGF